MEKNNSGNPPKLGPRGGFRGFNAEVEHPRNTQDTLLRLLSYFGREKLKIILIIAVVISGTLASIYAPNLQSQAIDIIARVREGDLLLTVMMMLLFYITSSLMQFMQGILSAKLGQKMVFRLREELFSKLVDLPLGYLDRHPKGDLVSRMTNDIENISTTVSQAVPAIVMAVLTIIGTASFMLYLCWQLALLSFIAIFITFVSTKYLAVKIRKHSQERQKLLGNVNALSEELISNYRSISLFSQKDSACSAFNKASDEMTRSGIRTELYSGILGPVMNCISNLEFVIIAVFGGIFALHGMLSIGVISAFIVYAKQFSRPVNEISMIYGQIQTALAGAERVFALMDEKSEKDDGDEYEKSDRSDVEFSQVNFSYDGVNPVIRDFSLKVKSGSRVAIVGETGSGKTTLVNLLLGFYLPDSGRILINDKDIASIRFKSLRQVISIVLQDTILFSDTLRNNLKYGKEDATDSELNEALMNCHGDAIVSRLPEGLGTVLEHGAQSISQGESQLLSIARAFVSDPQILILDEATSNVDSRTEKEIEDAMKRIMHNRTCFVIAHRLSTIRDADLIVVMDKGRIAESGTHETLLAQKGRYYRLCQKQFLNFES